MKNQPFISFLKLFREDAVFDSAGRLFHILAPRKEKHFCPLADLFFGNLKSVSVFRRLREEHAEFFVKRLHRYCGAKSLSDLKTIVLDSLLMSSSMVCQPNFAISGLLEASKLLFVMILAARFYNFCSWSMYVDPAQPHTEQQYRKWGSTIPV